MGKRREDLANEPVEEQELFDTGVLHEDYLVDDEDDEGDQ